MTYPDGRKAYLSDFLKPSARQWRLVVCGSVEDSFTDPPGSKLAFFKAMDDLITDRMATAAGGLGNPTPSVLLEGESDKLGVDIWAREYGAERRMEVKRCPPDFDRYGRPNAYYQRNQQMADEADEAWGFLAPGEPTGRSGTCQTLRMFRRQHKPISLLRLLPTGIVEENLP